MAEKGAVVQRLSEFAPFANLPAQDFSRAVPFPVLVIGALAGEPAVANFQLSTVSVPASQVRGESADDVVVVFQLRADKGSALVLVGRGSNADVTLPFETVSRAHAQVKRDEEGHLFIIDQGSKNGTWLNGDRLRPQQAYALEDGDRLKLGDVEGKLLLPLSFQRMLRSLA